MFQQNPLTVRNRQAEGALAGRSLVMKGTTSGEVIPATAGGKVIGYVADAVADDAQAAVQGDGALVELVSADTLVDGDEVVAAAETTVELIATLNPANNDLVHIVGRVESNSVITTGLRVNVRLAMRSYNHGE